MKFVIKAPLVTEKNTYHNAANVYVFEVAKEATKLDIRQAVEAGFDVKVKTVRTAVCRGQVKRNKFGISKAPLWKKAFVQLQDGQKIAVFEGV